MKLSELKKYIEENIVEILDEGTKTYVATPGNDEEQAIQQDNTVKQKQDVIKTLKTSKPGTAVVAATNEAKDEDEEIEDTYGKEDEDDKKDAKIKAAEPKPSDLKKIDKEFSSTKLAKKLTPTDQEKLDNLEAGIKKKLANPTKDNIEILKQLIKKPEIRKLFKDGGKDLKALISDVIR
jgi:rRNA maturation endonuclease Nob1